MERGNEPPENDGTRRHPPPDATGARRLGNPTRLIPRRQPVEPDPAPREPEVVEPEVVEPGAGEVRPSPVVFEDEPRGFRGGGGQFGGMFAPRSVGDGRVQVWGCSPGCLIASLLVSALLTLLLNAIF